MGTKKYLIIVGDGMGDYPLEELGGRTPLEVAKTPAIDRLASWGKMGLVVTIPEGMPPGSDVANMSLLGCDPRGVLTGRGPLEAAAMGIRLAEGEVAFRCNLVTLEKRSEDEQIMADYSAGHIPTREAHEIIKDLQKATEGLPLRLYPGVSYRHVLIWENGEDRLDTTPPHDIIGKVITPYRAVYEKHGVLRSFIERAEMLLKDNPVNEKRLLEGKAPANSVWPWGQGKAPRIRTIQDRCGLSGRMISAVDLLKGIGTLMGFDVPLIPGATGYLDTNYEGKVSAAIEGLEQFDLVYIHIEAPDETSHEGDLRKKIMAIEQLDARVVLPLLGYLENKEWDTNILIVTDHLTPIRVRTHVADPVPYLKVNLRNLFGERPMGFGKFCEGNAKLQQGNTSIPYGWELFEIFTGCGS
ncbi:MAG: cofactor-independent phosphoglycerate mutase [Syntrophobacterales bacterium]|nr:cofactor-independent phosphoglycerate mutase [Syntrophobacterales bacterium]